MLLKDYLKEKNISAADFAKTISKDRSQVHRYITGRVLPPIKTGFDIVRATDGIVSFQDIYQELIDDE